jgi:photosystem II stability/assembly factor-like uncharacterized protein
MAGLCQSDVISTQIPVEGEPVRCERKRALQGAANYIHALFGPESGIFRSMNGGRAWREVDFPTEFAPVISLQLSPNYTEDGTLYAGTESHGLFVSSDRGKTWSRLGG